MALDRSALLDVLEALRGADVDERIQQAATMIYQALIEAQVSSVIGAAPHERTDARTAQRNGHRPKTISTTAGDLELRIPKLRTGSFFPGVLDRRRRVNQSLFAVIMEAYLHGTSTRKVDDLVKALGADSGISKSEVSRICAELDIEVAAFRDHSLAEQPFRDVFLDATYCKARVDHRVVSQAVVVAATGVAADGRREVLGFDVGDSEDGAFWIPFLRPLKTRGLHGVQLVISDAHAGLKQSIEAVFLGASWQRCRVHFQRNVLAQVPKGHAEMVAAAIRTVFAQPDAGHVRSQLDVIAGMLGRHFPKSRPCRARQVTRSPRSPTSRSATGRSCGRRTRSSGEQGDQASHRRRRRVPVIGRRYALRLRSLRGKINFGSRACGNRCGCQPWRLTSTPRGRTMGSMAGRRDVFPLRFKNPRTRQALRALSEHTGVPMTDIAEAAIEHELILQGADVERRLEQALAVVRAYRPERDAEAYIAEIEAGERDDLDPFTRVSAAHDRALRAHISEVEDSFGIAAAFARH